MGQANLKVLTIVYRSSNFLNLTAATFFVNLCLLQTIMISILLCLLKFHFFQLLCLVYKQILNFESFQFQSKILNFPSSFYLMVLFLTRIMLSFLSLTLSDTLSPSTAMQQTRFALPALRACLVKMYSDLTLSNKADLVVLIISIILLIINLYKIYF